MTDKCPFCANEMPRSVATCPHCARPGRYPNVLNAEEDAEKEALAKRYRTVMADAKKRGAEDVLRDFEASMNDTKVVIARPMEELQRLAVSDNEVYATFYHLTESGVRLPVDADWTRRRRVAEDCFFLNFHEEIRFGCLSLDGCGLPHYGDCFLQLKDEMIAHRTSLLDENVVFFLLNHGVNPLSPTIDVPAGYRSNWAARASLCVAKLGDRLDPTTKERTFAKMLLRPGRAAGADDVFVEAHVYGPLTRRSLECVIIALSNKKMGKRGKRAILRETVEKLESVGVSVGERVTK